MIRSARRSDVSAIAALIRELAVYEKLEDRLTLDEDRLAEHLFGPRPWAEVLLAEEAGRIAGFALFFPNYSTFLAKPGIYLEDLFVQPQYRSQGHGKALFSAVAKIAVERGCGRFDWAVLDWNEPAIGFYKSLGAIPMNDWTVYRLEEDALRKVAENSQ